MQTYVIPRGVGFGLVRYELFKTNNRFKTLTVLMQNNKEILLKHPLGAIYLIGDQIIILGECILLSDAQSISQL